MHTFEKGDKRKETLIYEYTNANGQLHNETEDRKATSNLLYYGAPHANTIIWTLQEHWVKTRKRTTSSTAMRTY